MSLGEIGWYVVPVEPTNLGGASNDLSALLLLALNGGKPDHELLAPLRKEELVGEGIVVRKIDPEVMYLRGALAATAYGTEFHAELTDFLRTLDVRGALLLKVER